VRIDGGNAFAPEDIAQMDVLAFPHCCDLYRPESLGPIPGATPNPSGKQVGDSRHELVATDVRCCFGAAPETDQPTIMGRLSDDNIYTLDQFALPSGVEAHDAWILVFLSDGDNYREVYALMGEPQSSNVHPWGAPGVQVILGKKVPGSRPPAGVEVRDPLGLVPGV